MLIRLEKPGMLNMEVTMTIEEAVKYKMADRYAHKCGLFVLELNGEQVSLVASGF
jgi:hypothetical protein